MKAYNGLGVSYDLLGEFSRAVKAYEAALRLNPNLAYVYNNLGYSYLLQKKLDSAAKTFQQAVALDQENRQYHNNLALAYGKQGKYDLAFNEFKLGGNEEQARHHMARLFNQTPNIHSAETLVAKNLPPDNNQNGEENLAQTALVDQGIREENLEASSTGTLSPEAHKQGDKPHDVAFSKNSETSSQPSFPVHDETQSLSNNLKKLPRSRQSIPNQVEIQISNGNGVRHCARRVGSYLTKKGFKVTSLKNEPRFNKLKTKIYYCDGYLQDAYCLAKQIPQHQDVVKVAGFENRNIKVKIVVGKDIASYYKIFKAKQLRSL